MSGDKAEGRDIAPSINSEERPDLENYKSKYEGSSSTSNTVKTTDFDSVTTVPTPEGILKQDAYRGNKEEMLENQAELSRKRFYKLMQRKPLALFFILPL